MPVTEVLRHIRPQINFLWNSHIDKIPSIMTFTGNITHIVQDFINLPVNTSILYYIQPTKSITGQTFAGISKRQNPLPELY